MPNMIDKYLYHRINELQQDLETQRAYTIYLQHQLEQLGERFAEWSEFMTGVPDVLDTLTKKTRTPREGIEENAITRKMEGRPKHVRFS
jgi:hypothetical protein